MYKLELPKISGIESYRATVKTIRHPTDRVRYVSATSSVATCCQRFDQLAKTLKFHSADSSDFEVEGLCADDMAKLYSRQFRQNRGMQEIRDAIQNSAPLKICPYCGDGVAYELDHYLPKQAFAGTAVHPANLVPACRDCNRAKGSFTPRDDSPAVLHPYFDSGLDVRWLYARLTLDADENPIADFEVHVPGSNKSLKERIESHMEVFDLNYRFRTRAAQSLCEFQNLLNSPLGKEMDLEGAREYLLQTAELRSSGRKNTWQRSLHEAMADDEAYLRSCLELSDATRE